MNEVVNVVGFRNVSFTDDKGVKIEGYTIYFEQVVDDPNVTGVIAGKQFISSKHVPDVPCVGDNVIFRYNKYGKIGSVEVI